MTGRGYAARSSAAKHGAKELAKGVALLLRLGGRRLARLLLLRGLLLAGGRRGLLGVALGRVLLLLLVLRLRLVGLLLAVGRRRRPAAAVLRLHGRRAVGLLRLLRRVGLRGWEVEDSEVWAAGGVKQC